MRTRNRRLTDENRQLRQALIATRERESLATIQALLPRGIGATAIALDLEGESRVATIDRGALAGVHLGDGVIDDDGVVGRVAQVGPLTSKVLLLTDPASRVPALVQRGHWWGVATGTNTRVQLRYISQDAPLRIGDLVVTGRGQSFDGGRVIGHITRVERSADSLYQTAVVEPAVTFGRLGGVLVVPK